MKTLRVGFLGLGTVGGGALQALVEGREALARRIGAELVPVRAAVRDLGRSRAGADGVELVSDPLAVATAPDVDIVVEVIGGVGIAREAITAALRAGKAVVTANKELIAKHGPELFALAREHDVEIGFEGSVAGGIPIIQPLRQSLAGNRIRRIAGIINGTTNYILTEMSRSGRPFADLLAEAQAAGYAEADPTDDIEGHDAAYKLAILAMLAFETRVDESDVFREGISKIEPHDIELAARLGYAIKLLAIGTDRDDRVELRVHPTLVPVEHPLASVHDVYNAIFVEGSAVGQLMFYGRGAGAGPTGSAVVGDLVEVARNLVARCPRRVPLPDTRQRRVAPMDEVESSYFIRMRVADRPGVMATLAGILGEAEVSIAQMLQTQADEGTAEIVWITHNCPEASIQRALDAMRQQPVCRGINSVLRALGVDES